MKQQLHLTHGQEQQTQEKTKFDPQTPLQNPARPKEKPNRGMLES